MHGLTLVFMIMKQQGQFQMKNGNKMNYEMNVSTLINYSMDMCGNGLEGTTTVLYYMEERLSSMH